VCNTHEIRPFIRPSVCPSGQYPSRVHHNVAVPTLTDTIHLGTYRRREVESGTRSSSAAAALRSLYLLATRRDSKLSRSPAEQCFKRPGVIGVGRVPALLEPAAIWQRGPEAFGSAESAGTVAWSSGYKNGGDRV